MNHSPIRLSYKVAFLLVLCTQAATVYILFAQQQEISEISKNARIAQEYAFGAEFQSKMIHRESSASYKFIRRIGERMGVIDITEPSPYQSQLPSTYDH